MKKTLYSTLMAVLCMMATAAFTACSSDDDNSNKEDVPSIVGVWKSEQRPILYDGEPMENLEAIAYMWYKEDGTFVEADVLIDTEEGTSEVVLSENGKWSVENDVVTQTTNFENDVEADFDTVVLKFKVVGNTLHVTYSDEGGEATTQLQRSTVEKMQELMALALNSMTAEICGH